MQVSFEASFRRFAIFRYAISGDTHISIVCIIQHLNTSPGRTVNLPFMFFSYSYCFQWPGFISNVGHWGKMNQYMYIYRASLKI